MVRICGLPGIRTFTRSYLSRLFSIPFPVFVAIILARVLTCAAIWRNKSRHKRRLQKGQLPGDTVHRLEAFLHHQRDWSAVLPQLRPGDQVPHLRRRCRPRSGREQGLDRGELCGVSTGDTLRLQGPRTGHGERPPLHRAVRTAHQPVQRVHLRVPLVLDGPRRRAQRSQVRVYTIACAQFTSPARYDKTVLSVSYQEV